MNSNRELIKRLYNDLQPSGRETVDKAVDRIVEAKKRQGKVVVVTGSGPNLHEGVTTLIAELIDKGVVDGVTTSSAVVAHEMAGVLDEVKRVDGKKLGFPGKILPRGHIFEITKMSPELLDQLKREMIIDTGLIEKALSLEGDVIIKANNKELKSYADALDIYKKIGTLQALELVVLRNNQEKEIVYEIY